MALSKKRCSFLLWHDWVHLHSAKSFALYQWNSSVHWTVSFPHGQFIELLPKTASATLWKNSTFWVFSGWKPISDCYLVRMKCLIVYLFLWISLVPYNPRNTYQRSWMCCFSPSILSLWDRKEWWLVGSPSGTDSVRTNKSLWASILSQSAAADTLHGDWTRWWP